MALAGHDTAYLVFNDPATKSSYSGTLNGVVAGELIVACITACADSGGTTPSGWTVTLGGDTLTFRAGDAPSSLFGVAAIFTGVASSSGDQTLSVSAGGNLRACTGHAFRVTGFHSVTPIPNAGSNNSHGTNASALTSPSGVTTAANGNAIIGCIGINGGDTTALAVGAADGSTVGQSGTDAFNDHEWGVAWDRTPTASSVTFAWTWSTNPSRPGAAWVEVAEAAASGATVDAAKATLNLSPRQAGIAVDRNVNGATAALQVTPLAATVSVAVNVNAAPASLQVTPSAATVTRDVGVSASTASLTVTPIAAAITKDVGVSAGVAGLEVTTHAADISTALNVRVDTTPAQLQITGQTAAIGRDIGVTASAAALQIATNAASVSVYSPPAETGQQPGGFVPRPIIYVDREGRRVDLKAVRKATKAAVKAAPAEVKEEVRGAAQRVAGAIREEDVAALLAEAFARDMAVLMEHLGRVHAAALQRSVEQLLDDEAAFLILMAA